MADRGATNSRRIDPWLISALIAGGGAGVIVLLLRIWPMSPGTWALGAGAIVFAVVMYFNPKHWLKRRSSACLAIAGAAAAIPAIAGAIELPEGWVKISTDASPWVAGLFGLLALGFAWLDRGASTTALAEAVERVESGIGDLKGGLRALESPESALFLQKQRIERADKRIKVNPTATLDGVHYEIADFTAPFEMKLNISGPSENLQRAVEKMERGERVNAAELGVELKMEDGPGHPGQVADLAELRFSGSTPASVTLTHLSATGDELGAAEITGKIEGGVAKRFTAVIEPGVLTIELALPRPGTESRMSAIRLDIAGWKGHLITQLPGFEPVRQVFSRLPEGGILRFRLFRGTDFLGAGAFGDEMVQQLAPMGATIHWIGIARGIASELEVDIAFPESFAKHHTYEIDFARRFLDGETLPLTVNDVSVELTTSPEGFGKVRSKSEPITLELPTDDFPRPVLGNEVNLGRAVIRIRDRNEYEVEWLGAGDQERVQARLRIPGEVSAEVTKAT